MRKFVFIIFLCSVCLFMSGCKKDEVIFLNLSTKEVILSEEKLQTEITVSSNGKWIINGPQREAMLGPTIVSFDKWLYVSSGNGNGSQKITLYIEKSNMPTRSRILKLDIGAGILKRELTVKFIKK